jgi:hypothetical protein
MYKEILNNEDHFKKYYSDNKLTVFESWVNQSCSFIPNELVAYWGITEDNITHKISQKHFEIKKLSVIKIKKEKKK